MYHVPLLVVLVLDNENHVETRQNGGHEVNVILALGLVPTAVNWVGCSQNGAPRIQGCGDSSLKWIDQKLYILDTTILNVCQQLFFSI